MKFDFFYSSSIWNRNENVQGFLSEFDQKNYKRFKSKGKTAVSQPTAVFIVQSDWSVDDSSRCFPWRLIIRFHNDFKSSCSRRKSSFDFNVNECLHKSRFWTFLSWKCSTSIEMSTFTFVEKWTVCCHRSISKSLCWIRCQIFDWKSNRSGSTFFRRW